MEAPGETTATFAVNVMGGPAMDGLLEEMSVVVVEALLTVCEVTLDVLAPKLASPEYLMVIACVPTLSADVEKLDWPAPFSVVEARAAAPSRNVTVPLGVPP